MNWQSLLQMCVPDKAANQSSKQQYAAEYQKIHFVYKQKH